MTDEELWSRVLLPGLRRLKMKELLQRAAAGEGRIVCTGDLTENQIAEARVAGRMVVSDDNLGWVLLPWGLTTKRETNRERERCQGIATEVLESALRFRNLTTPQTPEWETWDTRVRAASDILTSIRAGVG